MLPLIFLVLGISAALTAYELSPRVNARVNDYARAIRTAHEAHRAADAHLSNAHRAVGAAVQHVQATFEAQRAAQEVPFQQTAPVLAPAPMPEQAPQLAPAPAPTSMPAPAAVDAHAGAARVSADAGIDHAIAATVANQQAAQSTADAARSAKTGAERRAAVDSASRVLERGKIIDGALTTLGVGQCGVRAYPRVTLQIRDAILAKLHAEGMTVSGNNPWDIDTQLAGVKLRALWEPKTQVLRLIVTASAIYASCGMIWERIDPTLSSIIGRSPQEMSGD